MLGAASTLACLTVVLLLTTRPASAEGAPFPGKQWDAAPPADVGLDEAKLAQARDYALTGGGSGVVVRRGKLVMSWGDVRQRYDLKSTTKSFGATALGVAVADGKVRLSDKAADLHPAFGVPPDENREGGWLGGITLLHLATHTAGFDKPGGYVKLGFRPGTKWRYSDAGPNWLAECLTLAYRRDLRDVMFERVFTPIGITAEDLTWRNNAYRPHELGGITRREFGSGIHANVDAMARVGYLYLRNGRWRDKQILPADFVKQARKPAPSIAGLEGLDAAEHGNASEHYGLLWWNNGDAALANVPRDAYWSWGLYDSLIVVVPSLDLVVARAGQSWKRGPGSAHYDVLRPFLESLAGAVTDRHDAGRAPPKVQAIQWAAPDTIVRRALGSDNWPMAWADDGHLYTAFGDGWGFSRDAGERKLSLGFARVKGDPDGFVGEDIPSPTGERTGDGARGEKASGILMVDGVMYLWARNAGNATLAWSRDRARTWTWADWKFDTSFGCPTFLNFGPDYRGARDGYVYTFSPDADDAYRPADRFVLARVPKERVADRGAYEFLAGMNGAAGPVWTGDVARRGAVLERLGRCSRSAVTYNAPLGCYLWVMTLSDLKRPGEWSGLAVYQAPEPWGPWSKLYDADPWDVAPGDSAGFPAKWMSADGRTLHLVFAGDDSFSVRRATLALEETPAYHRGGKGNHTRRAGPASCFRDTIRRRIPVPQAPGFFSGGSTGECRLSGPRGHRVASSRPRRAACGLC